MSVAPERCLCKGGPPGRRGASGHFGPTGWGAHPERNRGHQPYDLAWFLAKPPGPRPCLPWGRGASTGVAGFKQKDRVVICSCREGQGHSLSRRWHTVDGRREPDVWLWGWGDLRPESSQKEAAQVQVAAGDTLITRWTLARFWHPDLAVRSQQFETPWQSPWLHIISVSLLTLALDRSVCRAFVSARIRPLSNSHGQDWAAQMSAQLPCL